MVNYSIIDCINYPEKSSILCSADAWLASARILFNGRCIKRGTEDETEQRTHEIGIKILAGFAFFVTLPAVLVALVVKWWKKEEWQSVAVSESEPHESELEVDEEPEVAIEKVELPEDQEEFVEFLKQELALVQHLDVKLPEPLPGSWRKYGKKNGEFNDTFAEYVGRQRDLIQPDLHLLRIQLIGMFNKIDRQIMNIAVDYLKVFHNVPVEICSDVITMEQLKEKSNQAWIKHLQRRYEAAEDEETKGYIKKAMQRKQEVKYHDFPRANGQYDANKALQMLNDAFPSEKKVQLIGFTSEDLFTRELNNFVFGLGQYYGQGIWSKAKFGNPASSKKTFKDCLLRVMKISAHEIGHMRGLHHCTDYECNIGGYMSLPELDERPLLYCLQDTAKICFLTKTSLREQHQRILKFFQDFNETYDLECDFSEEIHTLKARLGELTS